jgi:hypothetical protein
VRVDVAPVHDVAVEIAQPPLQAGVADRRWAHVDAAASRTEVEGRTDDRNGQHRAQGYRGD